MDEMSLKQMEQLRALAAMAPKMPEPSTWLELAACLAVTGFAIFLDASIAEAKQRQQGKSGKSK